MIVAALAASALPSSAFADEDDSGKAWTFGGFGTVGFAHSSEHLADYAASPISTGVVGASRSWSYDVDSRIGAQLAYTGKQWSAVVQVVSEWGLTNSYSPKVEWANIKYQVTPDFSVRVGRIALPLFLSSDYRKASYALPWLRSPVELYGSLPITNSDGVDASYRWTVGNVKNVTQVIVGRTMLQISDTNRAHANGIAGMSNTSNFGNWSVRATALKGDLEMSVFKSLWGGLRQFGPQGEALAERYDPDGKRVSVHSIGASYDPGEWFVMGEVGRVNARSFLGDKTAGYVSGGYRFGAFTPYATFSKVVANTPIQVDGLTLAGLPPPVAAQAAVLNDGLNAALKSISAQDAVSLGMRWDVASSAAFKVQVDRAQPRKGSNGTLYTIRPGFQSGRPYSIFSVSLDFVF